MSNTNPAQFIRQVRQETAKVTWPTRKETMITTAMVFIFVIVCSIFFFGVDGAIAWIVKHIMGWGA
jgi:preprotein translocase subunit SecE